MHFDEVGSDGQKIIKIIETMEIVAVRLLHIVYLFINVTEIFNASAILE